MATITEWLASLGMSEYAQRFADNRIDDVSISNRFGIRDRFGKDNMSSSADKAASARACPSNNPSECAGYVPRGRIR